MKFIGREKEYRREWWAKQENQQRYRHAKRAKVIAFLGNKCCRCGFTDPRALQIDHVNGGGTQQRRQLGDSWKILDLVLKGIGGPYQLLCANCNWIKRAEEREYGHA